MTKSMIRSAVLLILSAVLFLGCTNSDGGNPPASITPVTADIGGVWIGEGVVTGGTQAYVGYKYSLVLSLSQVGSTVTGTAMNASGVSSKVTGTVDGQILTFTIAPGKPCVGSFSGAVTASNGDTELAGSYSGSDCHGTLSADLTAVLKGSTTP